MSFWAETFTFNGTSCQNYDLMLYDIGGDDSNDPEFASVVTVTDEWVGSRWRPYFYGSKFQNKLTFDLVFGVNECRIDQGEYLTRSEIDAIATWLTGHDEYHWLTIDQEDLEGIRYRCMVTGLKTVSYGRIPWALQATVTCDGPFAYRTPTSVTYNSTGSRQIQFENKSSLNGYYYPVIRFDRRSGTSFSIENVTDGGRTFTMSNIPTSITTIQVDNDSCVITDDQDINLYGNCNYNWLRLKKGMNTLNLTGNGVFTFECEFPVNTGG